MQLKLMKEFVPESMKFAYEVKQKTVEVTENAMANTADNLFAGLYSTYHSIRLAENLLSWLKIMQDVNRSASIMV